MIDSQSRDREILNVFSSFVATIRFGRSPGGRQDGDYL
jgi:hypothetical protein